MGVRYRSGRPGFSIGAVYRRLAWVYLFLRVIGPLVDTVIILVELLRTDPVPEWARIYIWSMGVLDTLNAYFCYVIWTRGKSSEHILQRWEQMEVSGACQ